MRHSTQKGFTLIEMLAVLAIFAVLTSVVVFNYTKFRSDTILTNMAYEIALSVREAQIYGVSARGVKEEGQPTDFSIPYGIYFPDDTNQYFLFGDTDSVGDRKFSGTNCIDAGGDTCVTPYTLQGNIKITDIDIKTSGSCFDTEYLSVVFKRPNPEPIIKDTSETSGISKAQITVSAPDGETKRYIIIANNGQISVVNNPMSCGI